jgi:hypothetical protein
MIKINTPTIAQMEDALIKNGFFIGGLTEKQIEYYYLKMQEEKYRYEVPISKDKNNHHQV